MNAAAITHTTIACRRNFVRVCGLRIPRADNSRIAIGSSNARPNASIMLNVKSKYCVASIIGVSDCDSNP